MANFAVAPPTTVTQVQVNDGSAQRSMVTSVSVTFSSPVVVYPGAFQLNRIGPTGPTGSVNLSAAQSGNTVTLTFQNGGAVGIDPAGSLADGAYQLTIVAGQIQGPGGS